MDNLLEQMANITKAHGYDILSEQVGKLKSVIKELIEVGELEDITFTEQADTDKFQAIVKKANLLSL